MALPLKLSNHWQTVPDLTIHDAAFWIVIQSDPLSHKLLCDLNSDLLDHYYNHPGGFEAVCKICDVLICEARAGNIKTTLAHSFLSAAITQDDLISKSDWVDWCRRNDYVDLSNLFTQYNHTVTPPSVSIQPLAVPFATPTASTPPLTRARTKTPPMQQRFQENEILRVIGELGFTATKMPPRETGKRGVKAQVRDELDLSTKVFDKAWERLRADGNIKEE